MPKAVRQPGGGIVYEFSEHEKAEIAAREAEEKKKEQREQRLDAAFDLLTSLAKYALTDLEDQRRLLAAREVGTLLQKFRDLA